jgi:type VI secretion system secreted protein Hcp
MADTTTSAHAQAGIAQMRRAADISLNIAGKKQGDFKGGSKKEGRKNAFDVWDTNYRLISPRDVATGSATGRRQHNPVVIYTEVEKGGIPQMFTALATNETLSKFSLQYWRSDSSAAKQVVYYKIDLTNAVVSEFEIFCDGDGRPNAKVAFTFDEIKMTWLDGNIEASDTWHGNA